MVARGPGPPLTSSGSPTAGGRTRALAADGLTAGRGVLGLVVGALIARGRSDAAAIVLGAAWATDPLDGHLARTSGHPTRLGPYDMVVDTLVGASVLVGLWVAGVAPGWLVVVTVVVVGTAYLLMRQTALGMALQAVAFGTFAWHLWTRGSLALWVPVAVAVGIGLLGWRRLFTILIPEFFRGLANALRLRRGTRLGPPYER